MLSLLKKEIALFFSTTSGYFTIIFFLIITGLFTWVFPDTSILSDGYSSLDGLFYIAPYLFMFLIPAITMRSFSEEIKEGTFELLATSPITDWQIVLGKFFGVVFLLILSLLPTLIYYFSIYYLGAEIGNIDTGAVIGSYIGLFLLGTAFSSIGLFCSSLTKNQIISFITAVFICFFFFSGVELLNEISGLGYIGKLFSFLSGNTHYLAIRRGVLDSRDLVYFISFAVLFLSLTKTILSMRKWEVKK